MSSSAERVLKLLAQLHTELGDVLNNAVQIALDQSSTASARVTDLEKMGYRITTQFTYLITASPMELVFEESLTEHDRRFLSDPGKYILG